MIKYDEFKPKGEFAVALTRGLKIDIWKKSLRKQVSIKLHMKVLHFRIYKIKA